MCRFIQYIVLYASFCAPYIYCKTPTELYVDLVRRYPDFLNYITLREIASFLRVTPETISHIRKNIKGIGFC